MRHFRGRKTKNGCIVASVSIIVLIWCNLIRDKKFISRDKNVDLPGILTCRTTLFECLRYIHLSLQESTTYVRSIRENLIRALLYTYMNSGRIINDSHCLSRFEVLPVHMQAY